MKIKTRLISALLCALMIISSAGIPSVFAHGAPYTLRFSDAASVAAISSGVDTIVRGDANADGRISAKDVLLVKKLIAGQTVEVDPDGADVNGDGHINGSDLLKLKRLIVGKDSVVFVERPEASIVFDETNGCASVTALRDDPSITVSFDEALDASELKYAVMSFLCGAGLTLDLAMEYSNGKTASVSVSSGQSEDLIFDYSSDALWTGSVESVTIGTDAAAGAGFGIKYVSFAADAATADLVAGSHGEYEGDPMARIIFDSAEKAALIAGTNNTTVTYSSSQDAAKLTVSGAASDPQSAVDYTGADLSADEYKYITITYMFPTDNSSSSASTFSEFFLCAGDVTSPVAECNARFTPVKDGNYHYEVISLASASYWTGDIHLIRLDPFASCAVGDTMYIDSICLTQTRADASAVGFERLASRGSAAGVCTADTTLDGSPATISYFDASSISGNACTFSGGMTALINGTKSSFNRFCFDYSTNAIIRGVAYYSCDGTEYEDEFFLENTSGATATFRSLILPYFSGKTADGLSMICFYTINSSSATLTLSAITEETIAQQTQGTVFLSNSKYKLGIDLLMGGGVNYLEDFEDNNASYGNLLNNYDVGRLVQQSYYGIDKAPYELGWWGGHSWQYNPVQGGDKDNNISRIVDFEFRGNDEFYVKARPMDWGQSNRITPSYMENVYTLTTSYVKIYNRFIDFSGYTHVNVRQELPAFYTISALKDFYYYGGSSPWTDGALTKKSDLPFWGTYPEQTTFNLSSNPEFWSAWCDGTGYGVGLYVPNVYRLRAGRHQYNGTADPSADPTNYVSPQRNMTLICGKPIVYSYLITAGSLTNIRNTFRDNGNLINNYSLEHYND